MACHRYLLDSIVRRDKILITKNDDGLCFVDNKSVPNCTYCFVLIPAKCKIVENVDLTTISMIDATLSPFMNHEGTLHLGIVEISPILLINTN